MPWNQYGENGGSYLVRGRHQMWIWPGWRRATRKSAVSPKSPRLGDIWWKGKKKGNPVIFKGVDLYVPFPLKRFPQILTNNFQQHWILQFTYSGVLNKRVVQIRVLEGKILEIN